MTDRELLELAAKAAGYQYIKPVEDYDGSLVLEVGSTNPMRTYTWNPLKDRAQALELAVQLHISVQFIWDGENDQYDTVAASRGAAYACEQIGITMYNEFDSNAATCLAIVRAAAEIGKAAKGDEA